MKSRFGFPALVLLTAAANLSACQGTTGSEIDAGFSPDSGTSTATVTFLHLNDLHAHLTPHADLIPDGPYGQTAAGTRVVERGGLARLATLIANERVQNPRAVLMNIGDTYHGGVESLYTMGNAIVDPVDALGIDVGVPGNWDFAYGPVVTRLRYTGESQLPLPDPGMTILGPSFPNLAANVTYTLPRAQAGQTMLPPTLLKDVGGVRVGFVGITSDIVPMMYAPLAFGFEFVQGEGAYRGLIDQHAAALRHEGAEIVVIMSELGIQKDYRLAQIVAPGVDVFFSAHTHEATFTPLSSQSGALVVEAGNDGYLGRMDITVSDGVVTERKWQLVPIGKDIPDDPAMKALVDTARAPFLAADVDMVVPVPGSTQHLRQPINTVVGRTAQALDRRSALESSFNHVFAELARQTGATQAAITPGFRFDAVVPEAGTPLEDNTVALGDITIEDVYRFFPVSYTIGTGKVTGARLKQIMQEALTSVFSTNVFLQGGGWLEGFAGVDVTLKLGNPDGQRISGLKLTGASAPLGDTEVVSVTGCRRPIESSDILCSHSGFTEVTDLVNPDTGTAWTPVDLFIDGIPHMSETPLRSIVDEDQTVLWPESVFVQPLSGVGP